MPIFLGILIFVIILIIISVNPWLLLIIPLVIIGIGVLLDVMQKKNEKEEFGGKTSDEVLLETIDNFKIKETKKFTNEWSKDTLIYSEGDKSIYFVLKEDGYFDIVQINYRDLLQVEIIQDSESITRTSRGSQLAGTIMGGLALGGTGAIIGGLSGKKNHHEKVKDIELQFVVNDTNQPIKRFSFFNFLKKLETNTTEYKKAYNEVYEWFKLGEVLIHQADKEDKQSYYNQNISSTEKNHSRINEIQKLVSLYKDGYLSQDEFNKEKQKVLNR
ncbi:hypothetical protein [Aquibacillus sediminis]|uniref:hypothetical protein n=1 Tax=Aquibacillus sediminis TaxID=2574734 RepID=UPI00110946F8|nr:hypothetical protein [Aquibacillus sediminis]